MEKICVIIGASLVDENDFMQYYASIKAREKKVVVIAVDGGYELVQSQGITPDLIVGDFDSLGRIPKEANVIKHPVMKNDTDMLLAIKEGLDRNCTFFAIFGGLGGRPDHSFANIQHLAYLKKHGARGILFGNPMNMTVIKNEKMSFGADFTGFISVFSLGEQGEQITLRGLKYELEHACLNRYYPLGISNEFIGKCSEVIVKKGELLIMWDKNHEKMPVFSIENEDMW